MTISIVCMVSVILRKLTKFCAYDFMIKVLGTSGMKENGAT